MTTLIIDHVNSFISSFNNDDKKKTYSHLDLIQECSSLSEMETKGYINPLPNSKNIYSIEIELEHGTEFRMLGFFYSTATHLTIYICAYPFYPFVASGSTYSRDDIDLVEEIREKVIITLKSNEARRAAKILPLRTGKQFPLYYNFIDSKQN